jgi:hypothetical protein
MRSTCKLVAGAGIGLLIGAHGALAQTQSRGNQGNPPYFGGTPSAGVSETGPASMERPADANTRDDPQSSSGARATGVTGCEKYTGAAHEECMNRQSSSSTGASAPARKK